MLDISLRPELPKKALVYLDGQDARLFKNLVKILGSEERAQCAIILTGVMAEAKKDRLTTDAEREVVKNFKELVGCDYVAFQRLVENL